MSAYEDETCVAPGFGLERIQRWMQAVVTHTEGVGAGVASEEARLNIDVGPSAVESIVAPSATLSGAERLAVYSHAYHARLLQCFRETFPALLFALGEKVFDLFALDYLKRHPPRGYTLDRLADDFARHLSETRPDADAPARETWVDFVIELATIETAFAKVYDGPGLEGRAPLRAEDLLARDDEALLETRPAPAPCLRLFAFTHPVHTYMLAARGGEHASPPCASETFVAMTRRNYGVVIHELDAPQYPFLQALDGRRSIAEALDAAAPPGGRIKTVSRVKGWLRDWTGKGFFETF
jgi:Putative DNA-binding domain